MFLLLLCLLVSSVSNSAALMEAAAPLVWAADESNGHMVTWSQTPQDIIITSRYPLGGMHSQDAPGKSLIFYMNDPAALPARAIFPYTDIAYSSTRGDSVRENCAVVEPYPMNCTSWWPKMLPGVYDQFVLGSPMLTRAAVHDAPNLPLNFNSTRNNILLLAFPYKTDDTKHFDKIIEHYRYIVEYDVTRYDNVTNHRRRPGQNRLISWKFNDKAKYETKIVSMIASLAVAPFLVVIVGHGIRSDGYKTMAVAPHHRMDYMDFHYLFSNISALPDGFNFRVAQYLVCGAGAAFGLADILSHINPTTTVSFAVDVDIKSLSTEYLAISFPITFAAVLLDASTSDSPITITTIADKHLRALHSSKGAGWTWIQQIYYAAIYWSRWAEYHVAQDGMIENVCGKYREMDNGHLALAHRFVDLWLLLLKDTARNYCPKGFVSNDVPLPRNSDRPVLRNCRGYHDERFYPGYALIKLWEEHAWIMHERMLNMDVYALHTDPAFTAERRRAAGNAEAWSQYFPNSTRKLRYEKYESDRCVTTRSRFSIP